MHFNRQKLSSKRRLKITQSENRKNIKHIPRVRKSKKNGKTVYKNVGISNKNKEKHYKKLSKWKNCLKGHPVFILGNSPCISSKNLRILDPYFTIGINRIFYIYDSTILLWQDKEIWIQNKKRIMKQKSVKICRDEADFRQKFINFKLFPGKFKFGKNPSRLYGRGNTGALAIQLAVLLGCSSIVLLGMDCKYGKKGKTDFYGKNSDHKSYTLKMCRNAMIWAKEKCSIPIYNCAETEWWERSELKKIIKELNPPKVTRGYFLDIFK